MRLLFLVVLIAVSFLQANADRKIIGGEKLYFTTDYEIYNPGDTISLCGILSSEQALGTGHYSNYVNIELINGTDSVVASHKVAVKDGVFKCVVPLDIMLHKGIYYLRGYTELMRSFRLESFPIKPLFVGEVPRLQSFIGNPDSVRFYPESGNWVADYLQGMTFCVKDKNGFPVETVACLIRENGDTIASEVRTNQNGFGIFYLIPEEGIDYFLQFESKPDSSHIIYKIPEVGKSPSFRVAINDRKLSYFLHPADKNENEIYNLLIWYRGECLAEYPVSTGRREGIFILPDNIEGIISCILVNVQKEVLAERLIYQHTFSGNSLLEKPVLNTYKAGEVITLNVGCQIKKTFISRILPVKRKIPDYLQISLPASFLLTSDVNSAIYAPDSYFFDSQSKSMELLSGSLQWGRYYWQDVLVDTFKYIYPPEEVLSLKGRVLASDNKPLKKGYVVCFNNETGLTYDCDIQPDGSFVMGVDDYEDGNSFYIQPFDEQNKSDGLIVELEEDINPKVVNLLKTNFLTQDSGSGFDDRKAFKSYSENQDEWLIQMSEVVVKSKRRTKVVPSEAFYIGKSVTPEAMERYSDIRHAITSIPYLSIVEAGDKESFFGESYIVRKNRGPSLLGGPSPLVILLDGQIVNANQILDLVNVRDVESISVLSPAQTLAFTPFALDGALYVKTKDYKYEFKPMGINYQPTGLSPLSGFNDKMINVTTGGEITSLTAPQEAGEYQLILEGIGDTGKPFCYSYPFTVEK